MLLFYKSDFNTNILNLSFKKLTWAYTIVYLGFGLKYIICKTSFKLTSNFGSLKSIFLIRGSKLHSMLMFYLKTLEKWLIDDDIY